MQFSTIEQGVGKITLQKLSYNYIEKNVDVKHGLIIESLYEVVNINMKISIVRVQFLTFLQS